MQWGNSNGRGGEGGIRTHGTREGSTVFETARFNHSRTSPYLHSSESRLFPQRSSRPVARYCKQIYGPRSGPEVLFCRFIREMTKVLVADDHGVVRKGLMFLLQREPGIE